MHETWLRIITRAWQEPKFKAKLLKNANQVLKEYGVDIKKGVTYKVVEDGIKGVHHLVLPPVPAAPVPGDEDLRIDSFGRKSQSGDPGF
jgi:hypothetical protein